MTESITAKNRCELESAEALLRQELAQLHHELRRIKDSLERNGSSHELEANAKRLSENINLCERELENLKQQAGD